MRFCQGVCEVRFCQGVCGCEVLSGGMWVGGSVWDLEQPTCTDHKREAAEQSVVLPPSHSILTQGRPVPALTQCRKAFILGDTWFAVTSLVWRGTDSGQQ